VETVVTELINRYSIPAAFSWLSYDMLPNEHPLYFGCPGGLAPIFANQILGEADVVVFLGARLDLGTTAFQRKDFGSQAIRYFIDIDENELAKFEGFPNSVSVRADLRALPEAFAGLARRKTSADITWLPWCEERRASYTVEENQRLASDKMNAYNIARRLSKWADGKVFVPASSGYAEETFTRFFSPGKGTRFFNGAALGSMGLGLPHSLGASFGSSRRVICLEADGGLMLNLQELATLVHYAPRGFVLFLLNNAGYESIRASQNRYFGGVSGVDRESGLYIPDYRKIAEAFGIRYYSVTTLHEFDRILLELSEEADPVFVDLKIDRYEYRGPGVKTILGDDGKPYSTPLAEISW
jgi:acetolactate synthase-1/2/3 large subunit